MKIGIDLGGSHIAIGVIDDKCYIVEKFENKVFTNERMGKLFTNMRITTEDGILVYITSIFGE